MNRIAATENVHLKGRIERWKREEKDLAERVAKRVSAIESEGGWVLSDPIYQSLAFILADVRRDLKMAEKGLLR
jgi:hypothetical protein